MSTPLAPPPRSRENNNENDAEQGEKQEINRHRLTPLRGWCDTMTKRKSTEGYTRGGVPCHCCIALDRACQLPGAMQADHKLSHLSHIINSDLTI